MSSIVRILVVLALSIGWIVAPATGAGLSGGGHHAITELAGHPDAGCEEHGPAHTIAQGGHCCVSAPLGLAAANVGGPVRWIESDAIHWRGDDSPPIDPVFGIFRPPRRA